MTTENVIGITAIAVGLYVMLLAVLWVIIARKGRRDALRDKLDDGTGLFTLPDKDYK